MLYSKKQSHQPNPAQPLTGITHVLSTFDAQDRYFIIECRILDGEVKGWRQIITLREPEYSSKIPFISLSDADFNYVTGLLVGIRHNHKGKTTQVASHLDILRTISRNSNLVFVTATQK